MREINTVMVFDKVRELWHIEGKLKMITPLRISSQSAEYSMASLPVLLRYDAEKNLFVPFVPGSSLKGVLRHCCTRIVNTQDYDEKLVENLFGGKEHASKVIVRDSLSLQELWTETRLHFGTLFKNGKPKGSLIEEEYIVPGDFDIKIDIVNPTPEEIALLLTALHEFNHLRLHIGGGVSRGYGFAFFDDLNIAKKVVKELEIKEEHVDSKQIWTIKIPKQMDQKKKSDKMGFDIYAYADNSELEGCVAVEFEVECLTNFYLKGAEEEIVTCGGYCVIPGSTIKGFLRHACYSRNGEKQLLAFKPDEVDELFGSRTHHASRILVSDAVSIKAPEEQWIPQGEKLKCWIVFDNVKNDYIKNILKFLCNKQGVVITGKTSTKVKGAGNKVKFVPKNAWKYTIDDPKYDLLKKVMDVINV
ncbi:MAG: RAMP superfamily CRISPR-associated protein [Fervidicoccaceae archaeon]